MGTKNEVSERHFIMDVVRNKITVSIQLWFFDKKKIKVSVSNNFGTGSR